MIPRSLGRRQPRHVEDPPAPVQSKAALPSCLPRPLRLRPRRRHPRRPASLTSYTACPPVAIPGADRRRHPVQSGRAAATPRAIDVVGDDHQLCRSTCDETGEHHRHQCELRRSGPAPRRSRRARRSSCPISRPSCRAATNVVAKSVSRVGLHFAGRPAIARSSTGARPRRRCCAAAATLPEDIRDQITRERRPAMPTRRSTRWPIPAVRAAVDRASFERADRLPARPPSSCATTPRAELARGCASGGFVTADDLSRQASRARRLGGRRRRTQRESVVV